MSLTLGLGCDALNTDSDTQADITPPPRDVAAPDRDAVATDTSDTERDPTESDTDTPIDADVDGDAESDAETDASDASDDASADTAADTDDVAPDTPPTYGGSPAITRIFPEIVLSEGLFYIEGEYLAAAPNDIRETRVTIVTEDGELGEVTISTNVVAGVPGRLVVAAPRDLHERLLGRGTVVVTTPGGEAEYDSIYATNDSTFSGKTEPGAGLVGNVYRLQPETSSLPNLDDACSDPTVLNTAEWPCPFTSILLENVNIPMRSWDTGFPGLLADVDEWFAMRLEGYLEIEVGGSYPMRICSDDGSVLWIGSGPDRRQVIDNNGLHSMQCQDSVVELTTGRHEVTLDYFQGPRNEIGLILDWQLPGGEWEPIPPEVMRLFELDEF